MNAPCVLASLGFRAPEHHGTSGTVHWTIDGDRRGGYSHAYGQERIEDQEGAEGGKVRRHARRCRFASGGDRRPESDGDEARRNAGACCRRVDALDGDPHGREAEGAHRREAGRTRCRKAGGTHGRKEAGGAHGREVDDTHRRKAGRAHSCEVDGAHSREARCRQVDRTHGGKGACTRDRGQEARRAPHSGSLDLEATGYPARSARRPGIRTLAG